MVLRIRIGGRIGVIVFIFPCQHQLPTAVGKVSHLVVVGIHTALLDEQIVPIHGDTTHKLVQTQAHRAIRRNHLLVAEVGQARRAGGVVELGAAVGVVVAIAGVKSGARQRLNGRGLADGLPQCIVGINRNLALHVTFHQHISLLGLQSAAEAIVVAHAPHERDACCVGVDSGRHRENFAIGGQLNPLPTIVKVFGAGRRATQCHRGATKIGRCACASPLIHIA